MKGITSLVLGIFGTLAFSWLGLAYVPNWQIGHLEPQSDEEGTDVYPVPTSGMAERGRKVYVANGCFYCHSEQVRADYAASDIDRKWGERRSAPRDYIFNRPVLLGESRVGPDISNVGKRAPAEDQNAPPNASPAASTSPAPPVAGTASPSSAPSAAAPSSSPTSSPASASVAAASAAPSASAASSQPLNPSTPQPYSAAWHHEHLYSPRSLNRDSGMPAYRFLYEKRRVDGQTAADALTLKGDEAAGEGWEIVPTYDAKCLVAYLMSLDQSHALKEVKSTTPVSPPAPGKSTK